jgi:hypothetical protein
MPGPFLFHAGNSPRMNRTLSCLLLLAPCAALAQAASAWQLTLRSDRHSDGLPLAELASGDPLLHLKPRAGRNLAYVEDEVRVGRRQGAWTWSLLARQSATLATNRDTLALALQASGNAPTTSDQAWQTRVRYQQFSGVGLEAGRSLALADGDAWQGAAAVQVLQLSHWRERVIDGPVGYEAATGTYRFDLKSHEADDRQAAPFQEPFAARGAGLLLHGELAWQAAPWQASLGVRDLGWLRWRGLPQQQLVLSTDTRSVDADGFVIYQPLVQGRDTQAGYTRRLGGVWTARVAGAIDGTRRIEASLEARRGFGLLPALAWQQRVAADADLTASWRVHERRLTLALTWHGLNLRLGADRLGGQARSRDVGVAFHSAW